MRVCHSGPVRAEKLEVDESVHGNNKWALTTKCVGHVEDDSAVGELQPILVELVEALAFSEEGLQRAGGDIQHITYITYKYHVLW